MRLRRLAEVDPEVFGAIEAEVRRQEEGLELIASENFASRAVMEPVGHAWPGRAETNVQHGP